MSAYRYTFIHTKIMEKWLKISLILSLFGFFKEIRPSEPFVFEYLSGKWTNFTAQEVNADIFAVGTYANTPLVLIAFLVTDLLRYKPLIISCGLFGIIVWSLLIWLPILWVMQCMEIFYAAFVSCDIAYFTYMYAKVDKIHYAKVTSNARIGYLFGRLFSGVIGQVLTSFEIMDYKQLNYITFVVKMQTICLLLSLFVAVTVGQFVNGRSLHLPNPQLCSQRPIHERSPDGKGYYYSWRDPQFRGVEKDWLDGRNYCRERCMDLVSLETSAENEWIKQRIVNENVKYIWTSGRLCDFKGCDRADLQPLSVNGWFWTATLQKLAPTTQRDQNDWSESGGIGRPQPDNREAQQGGATENCLAVLNQFYKDGVNWHDVACHHVKSWVCEENEDLLKYVRYTNPGLRV